VKHADVKVSHSLLMDMYDTIREQSGAEAAQAFVLATSYIGRSYCADSTVVCVLLIGDLSDDDRLSVASLGVSPMEAINMLTKAANLLTKEEMEDAPDAEHLN